jgi:ribosomal protein S18 acetylase RimI-like enzyme
VNADEMLEVACSDAWLPLKQDRVGDWRLRWADGFTGRANSALAVGDPAMPVAQALEAVCDFAHAREITPAVQTVKGSPTEDAVIAAGWLEHTAHAAGHEVSVLVRSAMDGPFRASERNDPCTASDPAILATPTPGWWEMSTGSAEPSPAERYVLSTGEVGFGVTEAGGVTAGVVRVALVGAVAHLSRLEVKPGYRRRGLAVALMNAAGVWAAERGAAEEVLQVSVSNGGALALYGALGFTEHHRYRYWVPPMDTCEDRKS